MTQHHGFVNPDIDPATSRLVDHAGLDLLSEDECVDLIRTAPIGRIGYVENDEVIILPVNIGWWDNSVVFSSNQGSKLHAAVMERRVTVEVDGFDESARSGWSVIGHGVVSVVTDGRTIASLDRLGVRSWVHPEVAKRWVQVRLSTLTGRRTPGPPPA